MTFSTQQKQDAIAQSFKGALRKYLNSDQLKYKRIVELKVIGFNKETALAFVNIEQSHTTDFMPLAATRGFVLKTVDGGENWQVTFNEDSGSIMLDELVFLVENWGEKITDIWFVTQWQIEGTFTTMYSSQDTGENWQKSTAVEGLLRSKGSLTTNFAKGIRFRNQHEGVVIAQGYTQEPLICFLQTQDRGKSWQEITSVPPWYFDAINFNWKEKNIWMVRQKNNEICISTINETFDKYL